MISSYSIGCPEVNIEKKSQYILPDADCFCPNANGAVAHWAFKPMLNIF